MALDRAFRQSQAADVDSATEGLQAVYNKLNADPDELATRAAFQQRLKLLVDHVVLGPSGFVVTHTDGSTSRTSFAGPDR